MMSLQVTFHPPPADENSDMRSRKKARTRLAIQDVALNLFANQGYEETTVEQIAFVADVSASTFFRYFGSKADIILNDQDSQLPSLCAAIRALPADVVDLEAVRLALQAEWVPQIDLERTIRTAQAVGRSAFLRGLAYGVGVGWVDAVGATLLERRGASTDPDSAEECLLVARTALGVFGNAIARWIACDAPEDFSVLIDKGFKLIERMCKC
ncbi:transcriptional regulator, TetR family [Sphingomonas sp. YR710]|nr:transcriptional regulator, TetR family [Sphingomonas sp. YR710]